MSIVVTHIQQEGSQTIVTFRADCGIGKGYWADDRKAILSNREYLVEFGTRAVVRWGSDITPTDDTTPGIWHDEEFLFLKGQVFEEEDNGTATIAVSELGYFDLETEEEPFPKDTWCLLRLPIREVGIYPYDLL